MAKKPHIFCSNDLISSGWLCFLPVDLSSILQSDKMILDGMKDWSIFNEGDIQNAID